MSLKNRLFGGSAAEAPAARGLDATVEAAEESAAVEVEDNEEPAAPADDSATGAEGAKEEAPASAKAAAAPTPADPAAVARACAEAGVASLAAVLIEAKLPQDQVTKRIESAVEIRGLVACAAKMSPAIHDGLAEDFIRTGASADHAGRKLLEMVAESQSPEIAGHHQPGPAGGAAADYGWGGIVEKVHGKGPGASPAADAGWGDVISKVHGATAH